MALKILEARKFSVWLFNHLLFVASFFCFRAFLLRLAGAKIGKKVAVHCGVKVFAFSKLVVGDNVTINKGCFLDNRHGIEIGRNVNISHDVRIYSFGHDIRDPGFKAVGKLVKIEDDVWIFPNVLVMPGVTLERGCVVLPGAVVTKSFQAGNIVGGNPAFKVGDRAHQAEYLIDFRVHFAV